MYTRLLTFTGATSIDAGVDYLREEALPILKRSKGSAGCPPAPTGPGTS